MDAVARLTWQTADPAGIAGDLVRRLGIEAVPHPSIPGARRLPFAGSALDVVPWRQEAPDDRPRAAGRLVFEPLEPGDASAAGTGPGSDDAGTGGRTAPLELVAVVWATVDIARAAADLGPWLDPAPATQAPRPGEADNDALWATSGLRADPHLGSRCLVRGSAGLPGRAIVLAEAATEGRLAAALARDDEGPVAIWLAPAEGLAAWSAAATARGAAISPVLPGPLGPSVLLRLPVAGPQVLLVDAVRPLSSAAPGATIPP